MALRRQGLSQRRKAVGLTQESLAEQLGVERSTVVRWEAGDTEPLPSIRPNMAQALHVSIDQLAELLTESENADTTRALSAGTEVTIPVLLPEVRPGRVELEDLIPQVADTVEALRRALRSAGVVPEDLDAMLLAGRSSQVPLVSAEPGRPVAVDADPQAGFASSDAPEPAQTKVPHRPSLTAIPIDVEPADVQRDRARSRRFKRFAAVGVLALVAGGASVPFIKSHNGPIPPGAAGTPSPASPVAAIPAPDSGSGSTPRSEGSTAAAHTAPVAAPDKPADGPATPGAAVVPAPRTARATSNSRTNSRSKSPAAATSAPRPRTPAIPAEASAWLHKAPLSAGDQYRTHLRPGPTPWP